MTIIRTKTKAYGGITKHERQLMGEHAKLWISRMMRTDPIEPDKIIPAIEGIYAAVGLKKPRIVVVPSPLVMAFAYGAARAIWYERKHQKTIRSKRAVNSVIEGFLLGREGIVTPSQAGNQAIDFDHTTETAIFDAVVAAYSAGNAVRAATYGAILAAAGDVEKAAAAACFDLAGNLGIACANLWWPDNCQDGNMGAGIECYDTACRDILGLNIAECAYWEQAAIHGGPRAMHEEFCMVSDFPEMIRVDARNRPHCETGPSLRWRDGWSLYCWHGERIPAAWIEDRNSLTPAVALGQENLELRRAACEMLGLAWQG
jgi:hypothetical protein